MKTLLASSNTLDGIRQCIAQYWCCPIDDVKVVETAIVLRATPMPSYTVTRARGRFRFEYLGALE